MAIRFLGLPGNMYSLHTSDDLASGKWRKLKTNEFATKTKVVTEKEKILPLLGWHGQNQSRKYSGHCFVTNEVPSRFPELLMIPSESEKRDLIL